MILNSGEENVSFRYFSVSGTEGIVNPLGRMAGEESTHSSEEDTHKFSDIDIVNIKV